jgi:hypothetical protein
VDNHFDARPKHDVFLFAAAAAASSKSPQRGRVAMTKGFDRLCWIRIGPEIKRSISQSFCIGLDAGRGSG